MKESKLKSLFDEFKTNMIEWKGQCHVCGKDVKIIAARGPEGIEITGGALYEVEIEGDDRLFLKCDSCFAMAHTLTKFRPCDVYSRTVGYYRPVRNMNGAKQAEFHMRKNFKAPAEVKV